MKRVSSRVKNILMLQHFNKSFNKSNVFKRYNSSNNESVNYPQKIFSGIQPSGALHLGNYLGAVQKWINLQNQNQNVTLCIVDMHSITIPQSPPGLRENIFEMVATLLACGIKPEKTTIFVQSTIKEHAELCWILNCLSSMGRLGQLPQFKEKVKTSKDLPLGIFVYPILQSADILLHKATHIPVGEDQIQHIQLANHLAKLFNNRYGSTFPNCQAMLSSPQGARIKSLRNPSKKMSKSDANSRAAIYIKDAPDIIVDKIKKAVTDFVSDVTYDPVLRPGVSNLIGIHSLLCNKPVNDIVNEARAMNTATYKMHMAEAVVEQLKPLREELQHYLKNRHELIKILENGRARALLQAEETIAEVKQKMGLGISTVMPDDIELPKREDDEESSTLPHIGENVPKIMSDEKKEIPVVPIQKMRMEKKRVPAFENTRLAPQFDPSESLIPFKKSFSSYQPMSGKNNKAIPSMSDAISAHTKAQLHMDTSSSEANTKFMTNSQSIDKTKKN